MKKLRMLRLERELSMDAAAALAGLSGRQRWYEIERGLKPNITLETLDKIATALGVDPADLLKRTGQ